MHCKVRKNIKEGLQKSSADPPALLCNMAVSPHPTHMLNCSLPRTDIIE